MALIDDVVLKIKAGDGGNGSVTFKTNLGSPKQHADGGNGGNGGDIYFQGSNNVSDLSEFRFRKSITAQNGENGMRKNLFGKSGVDTTILVPLGTQIIDEQTNEQIEIAEIGKPILLAKGGRGGIGNYNYKPDINRYQPQRVNGGLGEEKSLHLILNLIADVGLIGLPNAGKSSLLSVLTNAVPKIGAYPFTTLEPNLGAYGKIIIADIPGLIEGASRGRGLGITFLKHIEKTKILMHCIDATSDDPVKIYQTVRKEFEEYSEILLKKAEIILLTKTDLVDNEAPRANTRGTFSTLHGGAESAEAPLSGAKVDKKLNEQLKLLGKLKLQIIPVSIYDEKSISELKKNIEKMFKIKK